MLTRMMPAEQLIRQASDAVVEIELFVDEDDGPMLGKDYIRRPGQVVLLGEENGMIVGLTYRYFVDVRYPDTSRYDDYLDGAEFVSDVLLAYARREACRGKKRVGEKCRQKVFGKKIYKGAIAGEATRDAVKIRVFSDHDFALIYFHGQSEIISERKHLGVQNPSNAVAEELASSRMYAFEYVRVSPQSLALLRSNTRERMDLMSKFVTFAASILLAPLFRGMAAALFRRPRGFTLGKNVREQIEGVVVERFSETIVDSMRSGNGTSMKSDESAFILPHRYQVASVSGPAEHISLEARDSEDLRAVTLLGCKLPRRGEDEDWQVGRYLRALIGDSEVSLVEFSDEEPRYMLLLPAEEINVNIELLRHGFVRLDMANRALLGRFPELVDAAFEALDTPTGYGKEWASDLEYVSAVRGLRVESQ